MSDMSAGRVDRGSISLSSNHPEQNSDRIAPSPDKLDFAAKVRVAAAAAHGVLMIIAGITIGISTFGIGIGFTIGMCVGGGVTAAACVGLAYRNEMNKLNNPPQEVEADMDHYDEYSTNGNRPQECDNLLLDESHEDVEIRLRENPSEVGDANLNTNPENNSNGVPEPSETTHQQSALRLQRISLQRVPPPGKRPITVSTSGSKGLEAIDGYSLHQRGRIKRKTDSTAPQKLIPAKPKPESRRRVVSYMSQGATKPQYDEIIKNYSSSFRNEDRDREYVDSTPLSSTAEGAEDE